MTPFLKVVLIGVACCIVAAVTLIVIVGYSEERETCAVKFPDLAGTYAPEQGNMSDTFTLQPNGIYLQNATVRGKATTLRGHGDAAHMGTSQAQVHLRHAYITDSAVDGYMADLYLIPAIVNGRVRLYTDADRTFCYIKAR